MDPLLERQMSSSAAGPSKDATDPMHAPRSESVRHYDGLSFASVRPRRTLDRCELPTTWRMVITMQMLMQHMLAGAVAGISEHVAMYPMDTIKTRMQALAHPGQRVSIGHHCACPQSFSCYQSVCIVQLHRSTIKHAIQAVIKREGIAGLYGGVGVTAWSAG